jgi:hypothetical protein
MNNISKSHKRFSERLNNPRVLTNPEEFLGPNFEEVLNFWMILDDLSEEQLSVFNERFEVLYTENLSECRRAINLAYDASKKAVSENYVYRPGWAVYDIINSSAAEWATEELIAMYKIFEAQQPLTFFPMFLNL